METSRIFVRGLPPTMSADEVKKHFAKHSAITDVKFIPHRRIAYVGYKRPEDAIRAVKYHNKSFIHMSRIGVEIARSVDEQCGLNFRSELTPKARPAAEQPSTDAGNSGEKKRKRENVVDDRERAKLQEFLEVMKLPSQSEPRRGNDPTNKHDPADHSTNPSCEAANGTMSYEEYEVVPQKYRTRRKSDPKETWASRPIQEKANGLRKEEATASAEVTVEESCQEPPGPIPTSSDADWLRSRTSRLLGLLDVNDAPEQRASPKHEEVHTMPWNFGSLGRLDESTETDEEASQAGASARVAASQERRENVINNGRLFVRNLTYTTTEEELRQLFAAGAYGNIEELHLPIDSRSGHNKGFAHIQYVQPEAASKALQALDRRPFQGRLLHIMPADPKKESVLDDYAISTLPLRMQQQIKRKSEATSSTFSWNSMYMNSDAVVSSISDRLGVSKSELLDPTSSAAAVKQAHAETHIIQETKSYFAKCGVNLDAFKERERGDTAILVKNFSFGTTTEELRNLFEAHGQISRLLMPPSGTIAIVDFVQPDHARSAFGSLAYRKFKNSVLFLEKAPRDLFDSSRGNTSLEVTGTGTAKPSAIDLLAADGAQQVVNTSTLFIRNLNFITTTERLREVFQPLDGFVSARVKTKPNHKRPGQVLSMGFGFLEFRSKDQAQAALAAMDGYKLDGHDLLIRASHKAIDAAEDRRNTDNAKKLTGRKTKVIIKNLPFEATKKDIQSLVGPYGHLRTIRVPKKSDSSTRGFAFADFATAREAENAMDALRDTHLLGRRLVLDFAVEESIDPEQQIEKMQQKVSKQTDKIALQSLAGSGRKKFNVEDELDQG